MSKKFNKVSEIGVSPFSPTAFLPKAELLRFTKWFSENYKILSCGDYFSSHNNYHIKYVEKIIDTQTLKSPHVGSFLLQTSSDKKFTNT